MKKINSYYYLIILCIILFIPTGLTGQSNIDSLKHEINRQKTDTNLYNLYYNLSQEYMNTELDSALYYSKLSEEVANELGDSKRYGKALTNSGIINLMINNSEMAFECFSEALKIFKTLDDPELIGNATNNMGIYYNELGQLETALKYYIEGLKYWKLISNVRKMAIGYNNIGIVLYDQKDYAGHTKQYQCYCFV